MASFKIHKTSDYTVMSNEHLKDTNLSLKAKGLLSVMLSLPDGWDYSVLGLAALSKDGKDSTISALDELRKCRYVCMTNIRNDKGQYETIYDIYEKPMLENRCGKSESENPPQLNTKINNLNKEKVIINNNPKEDRNKGLDLSFVKAEFLPIMEEWLAYKKERKQSYTQRGVVQCYNNLLKYSNSNPDLAADIIFNAIGNNYQGFHALKTGYRRPDATTEWIERAKHAVEIARQMRGEMC